MIWSSPAVSGGLVYVGSNDGYLYALDAASGTERWRFGDGRVISSPAVSGGLVYVGSDQAISTPWMQPPAPSAGSSRRSTP